MPTDIEQEAEAIIERKSKRLWWPCGDEATDLDHRHGAGPEHVSDHSIKDLSKLGSARRRVSWFCRACNAHGVYDEVPIPTWPEAVRTHQAGP